MTISKRRGKTPWADVKVVVIGGGALSWTPNILTDLVLNPRLGGQIVLCDIDDRPLSMMGRFGHALAAHRQAGGRFKIVASRHRAEALKGADFVVITISVGGLAMMKHDLTIPRKYGIIQTVGDTVGPGGLFRGLRNVPVFKRIAEEILRHCPKAWVINYTNPMSVLTRTLCRHGVKAIGCCHEVFGAKKLIADLANQTLGRKDLTRDDVDAVVNGINHFTVITAGVVAGHDAMELLRRHAKQPGVVRRYRAGELKDAQGPFARHQVKLDMLRRYGAFGAAGDRHLIEFFPGLLTPKTLEGERWGVRVTTIDERIREKEEGLAELRRKVRNLRTEMRKPLKCSGEDVSEIIACLAGRMNMRTNVNRPNIGQVASLPPDVIVETNAWLAYDRVDPICGGPLPSGLQLLYLRHVTNQESIVEAALGGDRDLAFQVLLNDPLVSDQDDAEKMFRELLAAEADYLPLFHPQRKVRLPRRNPGMLVSIHGALAAGLRYF